MPFEKLGINSMVVAKYLGLALTILSFPVMFAWGPVSQRRPIQIEDALTPLLTCSSAGLAYWSVGGLEGGALLFGIAMFGALLFSELTRWRAIGLGIVGALVVLTRPEACIYIALGVLIRAGDTLRAQRRIDRHSSCTGGVDTSRCHVLHFSTYVFWRRVPEYLLCEEKLANRCI
jgi:hypothetical protein